MRRLENRRKGLREMGNMQMMISIISLAFCIRISVDHVNTPLFLFATLHRFTGTKIMINLVYSNTIFLFPLLKMDGMLQSPNLLNLNLNDIPVLEILGRIHPHRNPTWRPGHDQTPLLQCGSLTQETHKLGNSKNQVICIRILANLPVHACLQSQFARIADRLL
jgi:hypothetical protein